MAGYLLLQDGSSLLLQTGSRLVLQSGVAADGMRVPIRSAASRFPIDSRGRSPIQSAASRYAIRSSEGVPR